MVTIDQINHLKELIAQAEQILVIFPQTANYDQTAAASALALVLGQMTEAMSGGNSVMPGKPDGEAGGYHGNKKVTLLCPQQMADHEPELKNLAGLNEVSTKIGNQQLQISFAYQPEMVDKVSYHIDEETQRFHLVIKPQRGRPPLAADQVQFDYTGADADLILLVGVRTFDELEQLYFGYEDFYSQTTTVAIATHQPAIGTIKLNFTGTPSYSQAISWLLFQLQLGISADAATNLLAGIEAATGSFHSLNTTAETLELAGQLMRLGARRINRQQLTQPLTPAQSFQVTNTSSVTAASSQASVTEPRQSSTNVFAMGQTTGSLANALKNTGRLKSVPISPAIPARAPIQTQVPTSDQVSPTTSYLPKQRKKKHSPQTRPGGLDYQPSLRK